MATPEVTHSPAPGANGKPLIQRRGDVRSQINVPMRAALLPDGPLTTRPAPLTGAPVTWRALRRDARAAHR